MKHTPGPWLIKHDTNIFGAGDRLTANSGGFSSNFREYHGENIANAARIVLCVNELDGLDFEPGAIRELVDLLKSQGDRLFLTAVWWNQNTRTYEMIQHFGGLTDALARIKETK